MTDRPPDTLPEEEFYLPPRKRKPKPEGQRRSMLPPLWSILLTLFMALLLAGCVIAAVIALGGNGVPIASAEPVVVMISAVPSDTPQLSELFEITPTPNIAITGATPAQSVALTGPTLIPTATITPTLITIAVGAQVIVISPGGINVRAAPGTNSSTLEPPADFNQVLTVIGGPEVADDLTWWQIQDTRNNRTGWVAEHDGEADLIQVFVP